VRFRPPSLARFPTEDVVPRPPVEHAGELVEVGQLVEPGDESVTAGHGGGLSGEDGHHLADLAVELTQRLLPTDLQDPDHLVAVHHRLAQDRPRDVVGVIDRPDRDGSVGLGRNAGAGDLRHLVVERHRVVELDRLARPGRQRDHRFIATELVVGGGEGVGRLHRGRAQLSPERRPPERGGRLDNGGQPTLVSVDPRHQFVHHDPGEGEGHHGQRGSAPLRHRIGRTTDDRDGQHERQPREADRGQHLETAPVHGQPDDGQDEQDAIPARGPASGVSERSHGAAVGRHHQETGRVGKLPPRHGHEQRGSEEEQADGHPHQFEALVGRPTDEHERKGGNGDPDERHHSSGAQARRSHRGARAVLHPLRIGGRGTFARNGEGRGARRALRVDPDTGGTTG
jgi:hypothetical protein